MKRTIEIEDTLQERIDISCEETKDAVIEWLNDNPESTEAPCLYNDIDYDGQLSELIDSNVPIYTYDIKCLWFCHDTELEEAYENHGLDNNPRENDGMVAIYCLIIDAVGEWYEDNKDEIFTEWEAAQGKV